MPETLDYLGREAPLSLNERAPLPTGVSMTPSTAPVVTGDNAAAPGGAASAAPTLSAPQGAVTRFFNRLRGLPENAAPGQALSTGEAGAVMAAPPALGGEGSILEAILGAGSAGKNILDQVRRMVGADAVAPGGGATLDPGDFSLSGDGGGDVLSGPGAPSFSFDAEMLFRDFPELLRLQGLFNEGGAVLDPSAFNLSGAEGTPTLDTGDFSLGVDTSIQAPDGSGSGGTSIPFGAALSALTQLGPALMNAGNMTQRDWEALIPGLVQTAVTAAIPGYFNPFDIPKAANAVYMLLEGNSILKRRAERTQQANVLQGDIMRPLAAAKTPEELVAAFSQPVGGSTVGDALAAMLWNNLQGTYYTDTAHNWAPDLSYLPLLNLLQSLGYTGQSEPTLGGVGGVGEIIAGAGGLLIPSSESDPGGRLYPGVIQDEGGQLTGGRDRGGLYGTAAGGALGWESVLQTLSGADGAPSMVAPAMIRQEGVRDTSGESGGFINPQTGDVIPQQTGFDPAYLEALRSFSPDVARRVEEAAETALQVQMGNPAYVGYAP